MLDNENALSFVVSCQEVLTHELLGAHLTSVDKIFAVIELVSTADIRT